MEPRGQFLGLARKYHSMESPSSSWLHHPEAGALNIMVQYDTNYILGAGLS